MRLGYGKATLVRRARASASGGAKYSLRVANVWTVKLSAKVEEPFEVYINGVLQKRGEDYEIYGRTLAFSGPLAQEGRLGAFRWLSMFLGIAGTYRKHDSVDVIYRVDGRRTVATGLAVIPPDDF